MVAWNSRSIFKFLKQKNLSLVCKEYVISRKTYKTLSKLSHLNVECFLFRQSFTCPGHLGYQTIIVRLCFFYMIDIELPLSVVRSQTFITLQPQIWYDAALTGHMSNPPVLHSSEGQKNEKPGSVVSHCWPWLQVIKALLSFCQSSDSSNISPWLISAVSSVRAYSKPWKDQHPVSVFTIHLSIPSSKNLT